MGKQKEMIGGCCVCSDERGWDENPLVYCDGGGCNVAVHQACYGIVTVPSGPWFCRKCESQERAARVRCELCPLKEGALKRTDNGGWCHVVCALFIPEAWFGNVQTMEPIILKGVPAERFNKSCYICEENQRESKATTGACMQCNRSGCRQNFHVTCAQQLGLLCEEAGNYDNVKYCGYCLYHFKKLGKDSRTKTIPAFKPPGSATAETPDASPDKKFSPPFFSKDNKDKRMKGKGPPDTASTTSGSSTVSPDAKLDLSPSSMATATSTATKGISDISSKFTTANFRTITTSTFTPAAPTPPNTTTSGDLTTGQSTGLLTVATSQPVITPTPSLETKVKTTTFSSQSFAELANAPLFAKASMPVCATMPENKLKIEPESTDIMSTATRKRSTSTDRRSSAEKKTKAKKPKTERAAVGGKGVKVTQEKGDPKELEEKPKKGRKRKASVNTPGSTPISPLPPPPPHTVAAKGAKGGPPPPLLTCEATSNSMHSPTGPTATEMPALKAATVSNGIEPLLNGANHPNLTFDLPKPPNSNNSKGLLTDNNNQGSMPTRMEQLLEQQWEQGAAFIMDHGQQFDIASLLSCLYRLRQENQRLEEHISQLTQRRDHLLAVNARLAVPLNTHVPETATTSTASVVTPSAPVVTEAERRTPVSGARGRGWEQGFVNGPLFNTQDRTNSRSPARASPLTNHLSSVASSIPAHSTSRLPDRPPVTSLASVVAAGLGVGVTPSSTAPGLPPTLPSHPLDARLLLQQSMLFSAPDAGNFYQALQQSVMGSLAGNNPQLHATALAQHRPGSDGLGTVRQSPTRKTPTSDKTKEKP